MQIKEIKATILPDLKIKRVAAYARVSSDKDAALHSVSAQISYYNELITNHPGWDFAGIYADEGIIETMQNGQSTLGFMNPIKVHIDQFYGIEINDFAVTVAKTALWIAESQMMQKTERIMHQNLNFLPLKTYTNIVEGNALRIEWNDVISSKKLSYIMGNPPFIGARMKDKAQAGDMDFVFDGYKNYGNLDYVAAWYMKAALYIRETEIECAFVSTNSISQGEQVAILWEPLMNNCGIFINFAYRTFRWDSEANLKANVACVIIGFSRKNRDNKYIYDGDIKTRAKNINGYLVDADNVFVSSRQRPICDVPEIGIGNKPIDGGNYLFSEEEKEIFVGKEPRSEKYFKKWVGAEEFINRRVRYCLWLGEASPAEIRSMPLCEERVRRVRAFRLASSSAGTRKIADNPTRFHVENMPKSNYLLIPRVSSERRRYAPIGYIDKDTLASDSVHISTGATIYHFGILTSSVHMAWMRAVCGRLESRYRYSKDIVYNNFPWPEPSEDQKRKIEKAAQNILDIRAKYKNESLADLYDDATMPIELRKAHQINDIHVLEAYGLKGKISSESECVAELMKLYEKIAHA